MYSNIIKDNLRNYYDLEADYRDSGDIQDWKKLWRNRFLSLVQEEDRRSMLELGAGTGKDSRFFMDYGLDVTAVDLSPEMVKKCMEKSINAYEMDFYNIGSLNKKFDCIWSMNSLLHVPANELPMVLREINMVLNESGLFFMGVYGGKDLETNRQNDFISIPRFFSSYSEANLINILNGIFDIMEFKQDDVSEDISFQAAILRKKGW